MKILFITYELPPLGGGGGRAAWQIARRLAGRGHHVRVLTSHYKGLHTCEALEGVGIHRIQVRRKRADACTPAELISFMRRSIPETRRLAKEFGPDVVCAFFAIPGGPAAWRLWRRMKIPYVISLRGSDVPRPQLAKYQRLHVFARPVIKRVCRSATRIVAVSGALREAALDLLPGVRIDVIPNGVDTDFFRPVEATGAPRDEFVFVGRLREFKGVHHALRALPAIEKTLGRPVRFTIVGEGPMREKLAAIAAGLDRAEGALPIRFTGWLEPEKVRDVYASASLLVLPSLVEGHPNVILEAMAMGLPCVASDVPGIREVVESGRTGILVPPEDPESIARAVCEILGHAPFRDKMGRAARAAAEECSWDRVAEHYGTVLAEAADAKE